MPITDYPFAAQLHADRTARIVSERRLLNLPSLHLPRLGRRQAQRPAAVTTVAATTC